MKKVFKKSIAFLLAFVMVSASFLQWMPAMTVQAEESTSRMWIDLTPGSSTAGGHSYSGASGPMFYTHSTERMVSGGTISMALKPGADNWGVFYSYIDDNNWLYIGHDGSSSWYYQYRFNGQESYPQIAGLPDFVAGEEFNLTISLSNETLEVTVNDTTQRVTNQKLKEMAEAFNASYGDLGKFGIMAKNKYVTSFADFTYDSKNLMDETKWQFNVDRNDGSTAKVSYTALRPVTGTVTDADGKPVEGATVRVGSNATVTDAEGKYEFPGIQVGEYNFAVTKAGYEAYTDTVTLTIDDETVVKDAVIQPKTPVDLLEYDTIESEDMTVYIGKDFPVVARYIMKSDETGNTYFRGNETDLNKIVINGIEIEPQVTVKETTESSRTYTLAIGAQDVPPVEDSEVVRLFGQGRYDTAYAVANELKAVLGVEKFEAAVVATGTNFADALAGSYLAVEKNAPILLTNGKDDNVAQLHAYIKENVAEGGKVYILGGEGAVPAAVDKIDGYKVERLFGNSRYDTNLAILEEAGVTGDSIIVATGKTFADSLSASAAKLPILLVKPDETLNDAQKAVLTGMKNIYIVGGDGAVSASYEAELKAFGTVTRVYGDSRYDTSVEIAKTFCKDAEKAVVASGKNFPDGLCGGPLAAALNAPLVLTKDGGTAAAAAYVAKEAITGGYVLGGDGALTDATVVEVFALESADEIKTGNDTAVALADAASDNGINLVMDVKVSVEANTLTWEVTELTKGEDCVKIATIDIPELNLLSVDATEEDSVFAGAQASTTTTNKADTYITFDEGFVPSNQDGYLYAFLTNGKLSAGLHSNSEKEGDKRVERINTADSMSLTSAVWYYESGDVSGGDFAGQPYAHIYDYPVSELPQVKVAIADGDLNGDGDIDWNDGAIAFRDIMHYAQDTEVIKDIVNYRIVMNFESAAPNPFLVTADNVKKVYLATDGLPQALLLKGYGNEGHDSANSEYADIAEREGGVEDFQDLIKIAHDYNTEIGIHVNAQEIYPEARSMNETMYTREDGAIANTWGWLDQSVEINKLWDLSSNARLKRFVQLYDRINETDFYSGDWEEKEYVKDSQGDLTNGDGVTAVSREEALELVKADAANRKDNMDFIYLDVWYEDAWQTRRIAEEINALGWRFSTEFSSQGEYDSTWQHWSTDTTYGGAGSKGFNSDIIRFLRNDQRDSQVLNWPAFGGTADNPLLGGFRVYGFEGWGGDQDFDNYIYGTFTENVPTKFLQHYEVMDWENYGDDGSDEKSPVGNTEKQITLANDEGDVVVVTRNEEQRSDIEIERTITLNGKVVLNTDADEHVYLLPWTDNQNGEEKLYHWNLDGGTTTWDLQEDWAALKEVVVYELSDQGRINETKVAVVDGTVTLEAKASTGYVVVKGAAAKELVADFGECENVVDPGFNGYTDGAKLDEADWSGDIDADGVAVIRTRLGDQKLKMDNTDADVAVTTKLSGLTAGEDYVAEIYVANESDARATLTVNTGSKEVSVYTDRSIAQNYVSCDSEHGTKMNRMQVSFVAEGETATLTLSRTAGTGYTHWDDIRIVEQKVDNFKEDGSFVQDFESVVQGLYPFVLGYNAGGDSRTHLSQDNGVYTSQGWNGKAVDDVIDGEWALKHHCNITGLAYRTIPQNFRFEPGKVYTVEFDYQTVSAGYQMVVGDGTTYTTPTEYLPVASDTEHVSMQVVGSGSGQTWIGLYMNGSKCYSDTATGTVDFILDNLKITENDEAVAVTVEKTDLYLGESSGIFGAGLDKVTWSTDKEDIVSVDKENNQINAVGTGEVTLTASWGDGESETFNFTVTDTVVATIPRENFANMSATANTEEAGGEGAVSGYISAIVDGDSSTFWHTNWSGEGFTVSESNPAIITVDLGETMTIGGFRFQQRNQANRVITQYGYEIKDAEGTVLATERGIEVEGTGQQTLAWVNAALDKNVEAKTVVVYVEEVIDGGFGCMAEFEPILVEKVATKAALEDATVAVGAESALEATPVNGTMLKGLVWTSSDKTVATVDQNGVVTGVKAGTVTITLSNALGKLATCKVTVK